MAWRDLKLHAESFQLPGTNTLEIQSDIDLRSAKNIALEIKDDSQGTTPIAISFDGTKLRVMDAEATLPAPAATRLNLRIFIDRSVLEVFANDTVCVTKVIPTLGSHPTLHFRADGGDAEIEHLRAWPMDVKQDRRQAEVRQSRLSRAWLPQKMLAF
jgi:beta-fructofuranosidase